MMALEQSLFDERLKQFSKTFTSWTQFTPMMQQLSHDYLERRAACLMDPEDADLRTVFSDPDLTRYYLTLQLVVYQSMLISAVATAVRVEDWERAESKPHPIYILARKDGYIVLPG